MKVYAIWVPARKAFIGSSFYVFGKPKIYLVKGAAWNKAAAYSRYSGEVCEVKTFELLEVEGE